MDKNLRYHENKNLTYDDLYGGYSESKREYEFNVQCDENEELEKMHVKKQYSKEEIDNILKECIENMVIEIKDIIDKKFGKYNFPATYNKYVNNWNEVLCSIEINRKLVDVKLTNDYKCDDFNNISSVYITVFSDGKGIFTECIERINQEYEFIGSTYAYAPVNESELCFKEIDKEKIIKCIISEINKMI